MPEWADMSPAERAARELEDSKHTARIDALRIGRRFESALDHYAAVFGALGRIDEGWAGGEEEFQDPPPASGASAESSSVELPPDTPSES
jgi:hypothetical protein